MIKPELFDSVELLIDLPDENLRAGDKGAIVHQHDDKNFEVEFMNAEGETLALVTVNSDQFRRTAAVFRRYKNGKVLTWLSDHSAVLAIRQLTRY